MKSDQDYAKQIAALEGHADALRDQRALALPGSTEQERIIDLLELVSSTLTKLRTQLRDRSALPVHRPEPTPQPRPRQRPIVARRPVAAAPDSLLAHAAACLPPVGHLALTLPRADARPRARTYVPDAEVEFETVWTPHRDAPSLLGEYPNR
jgi:hypothetical protein